MIYRLYKTIGIGSEDAAMTVDILPQVSFIFDPANTDYAEFKKAVMEGAELQDADGLVMDAEVAKEFVRNLP